MEASTTPTLQGAEGAEGSFSSEEETSEEEEVLVSE